MIKVGWQDDNICPGYDSIHRDFSPDISDDIPLQKKSSGSSPAPQQGAFLSDSALYRRQDVSPVAANCPYNIFQCDTVFPNHFPVC